MAVKLFRFHVLLGNHPDLKLRVTNRSNGWHVCNEHSPGQWVCGPTVEDAITSWLRVARPGESEPATTERSE
jgi:hypothetical protein